MGLLRIVLVLLLIYFGLKIVSRLFAPFLLKYMAKKAEQTFGSSSQTTNPYNSQKNTKSKVGDTEIDYIPNTPKTSNSKVGEYVDFEEID